MGHFGEKNPPAFDAAGNLFADLISWMILAANPQPHLHGMESNVLHQFQTQV